MDGRQKTLLTQLLHRRALAQGFIVVLSQLACDCVLLGCVTVGHGWGLTVLNDR
jgi:hypothetical protein